MHLLIVLNPNAGSGATDHEWIMKCAARTGHTVDFHDEGGALGDLTAAAHRVGADLVVAAGGDGTVRDVFRSLADADVHAAVLPFGTANNVARTLGIPLGDADAAMAQWAWLPARPFDVLRVEVAGRVQSAVESVGGGLFASLLGYADSAPHKLDVDSARSMLRQLADGWTPSDWEIDIDGTDVSGTYAAVHVLNIKETGPNVELAPDADPGDGLVDVVLVEPEDRALLEAYASRPADQAAAPLPLRRHRARKVRARPLEGVAVVLDDELVAREPDTPPGFVVTVGSTVDVLRADTQRRTSP